MDGTGGVVERRGLGGREGGGKMKVTEKQTERKKEEEDTQEKEEQQEVEQKEHQRVKEE